MQTNEKETDTYFACDFCKLWRTTNAFFGSQNFEELNVPIVAQRLRWQHKIDRVVGRGNVSSITTNRWTSARFQPKSNVAPQNFQNRYLLSRQKSCGRYRLRTGNCHAREYSTDHFRQRNRNIRRQQGWNNLLTFCTVLKYLKKSQTTFLKKILANEAGASSDMTSGSLLGPPTQRAEISTFGQAPCQTCFQQLPSTNFCFHGSRPKFLLSFAPLIAIVHNSWYLFTNWWWWAWYVICAMLEPRGNHFRDVFACICMWRISARIWSKIEKYSKGIYSIAFLEGMYIFISARFWNIFVRWQCSVAKYCPPKLRLMPLFTRPNLYDALRSAANPRFSSFVLWYAKSWHLHLSHKVLDSQFPRNTEKMSIAQLLEAAAWIEKKENGRFHHLGTSWPFLRDADKRWTLESITIVKHRIQIYVSLSIFPPDLEHGYASTLPMPDDYSRRKSKPSKKIQAQQAQQIVGLRWVEIFWRSVRDSGCSAPWTRDLWRCLDSRKARGIGDQSSGLGADFWWRSVWSLVFKFLNDVEGGERELQGKQQWRRHNKPSDHKNATFFASFVDFLLGQKFQFRDWNLTGLWNCSGLASHSCREGHPPRAGIGLLDDKSTSQFLTAGQDGCTRSFPAKAWLLSQQVSSTYQHFVQIFDWKGAESNFYDWVQQPKWHVVGASGQQLPSSHNATCIVRVQEQRSPVAAAFPAELGVGSKKVWR